MDGVDGTQRGWDAATECMYVQVASRGAGFWGAVTSSVDWCESNYDFTFYVAELFNTLSSLAMVVVGEFGVRKNHATSWKHWMSFRLISLVGFGSVLFHMTLKYHSQMLDELPMVWTSALVLSLCLEMHFRELPRWVAPSLLAFTLLASVATSLSTGPSQVALFRTAFALLEMASVILGALHYHQLPHGSPMRRLTQFGSLVSLLAFSCWLADVKRCPELSRLPINPQLHAIWHVLISVGIYQGVLYCVYLHQARFDALPPVVNYEWGVIPYLTRGYAKP
ncbi:hypothetical protein L0F63_002239 [Massospora cicadina]|nr:hypothetical protein L0F63_002239 [Massospora cicadina]